jgi:preprotein translocase subunit SecD
MRKSGSLPLLIVAVVAVGVFVATLVAGNKPGLGLDLQGGISVVLQPVVNGQPQKKVPAEALDQTKQIIENRVNAIGVGEPDITVQGKDILV